MNTQKPEIKLESSIIWLEILKERQALRAPLFFCFQFPGCDFRKATERESLFSISDDNKSRPQNLIHLIMTQMMLHPRTKERKSAVSA